MKKVINDVKSSLKYPFQRGVAIFFVSWIVFGLFLAVLQFVAYAQTAKEITEQIIKQRNVECEVVHAEGYSGELRLCSMPERGWCLISDRGVGCYTGTVAP